MAIVRKIPAQHVHHIGAALTEGGLRAVEVTLNTPGALGMIEALAKNPHLIVGAGTVLDEAGARAAIAAGARLIVSPNLNADVIRTARRYGAIVIPGAMTPTEILTAWELGADIVKVFPAATLGSRYFKEVKAPLDQVHLMATGGITPENLGEFIAAGADAVGMGGALISQADLEGAAYSAVVDKVRRSVNAVAVARGQKR